MALDPGGASGASGYRPPPKPTPKQPSRPAASYSTSPAATAQERALIEQYQQGYQYQPSRLAKFQQGVLSSLNPQSYVDSASAWATDPLGTASAMPANLKRTFTTSEGYGSLLPALLLAAGTGGAGAVGRTAAGPKAPISRVMDYPTGTPPATRFPLKNLGKHAGFDRETARQLEVMKAPTMAEHIRSLDRAKQIEFLAKGKPYQMSDHAPNPPFWSGGGRVNPYNALQSYNNPEGFFFDVPKYQPKPDYFSGKKPDLADPAEHGAAFNRFMNSAMRPLHSFAVPEGVRKKLEGPLAGRGIRLPDEFEFWGGTQKHPSGGIESVEGMLSKLMGKPDRGGMAEPNGPFRLGMLTGNKARVAGMFGEYPSVFRTLWKAE